MGVFNLRIAGALPAVYSDVSCGSFPVVRVAPSN